MEVLSEHMCQGWLEGYLLTGRHGFFSCYEAFVHVIDSMFNQHAKWLKVSRHIPWRRPIASLNYLLTSHVWRQDHNGFSHQDPGFIDLVVNKKAEMVRVYLPPDANTPAFRDRPLSAQPALCQRDRCRKTTRAAVAGYGAGDRALHRRASAFGNGPVRIGAWSRTWSWPARAMCLRSKRWRRWISCARISRTEDPRGQCSRSHVASAFDGASSRPDATGFRCAFYRQAIIFAFHGYPWLIHRLTYRRNNKALHVRGYKEEGTTTTPFDMCVMNEIDRFHLAMDAIDRVPRIAAIGAHVRQTLRDKLTAHWSYVREHGDDMPEIKEWKWWPHKTNAGAS